MHLTLTELRYVAALAQEKHFGKAAQKCFVSQPTLSIAIKKLEENLGVVIFERIKNKVCITTIGSQIIAQAQQVLDSVTKIYELASINANQFAQPLRIGAIHTVGPYLFPKLISALYHKNSPIKLFIEEGFTNTLQDKLNNGELDAIIIAKPFNKPNLITIDLYDEALDLIIPTGHEWHRKTFINPIELKHKTILLLGNGHCFRDQVLNICPQCQFNPPNEESRMIITSSIETIKYMVAENIGISIIPRSATLNLNPKLLVSKQFTNPTPTRQIALAYRTTFSRQAIIKELATIISKLQSDEALD